MKDYYTTKRQENIRSFVKEYYNNQIDYIIETRPIPEKLKEALNVK